MKENNYKRAFVLLIDGARYDVFADLLNKNKLPNIEGMIQSSGSLLKGITSFPSTTGPAYMPYLTGCLPATCNVPGIRWLDKSKFGSRPFKGHRSYVGLESFLIGKDIDEKVKTVFQELPKSYSIFNPITKGIGNRNLTNYSRIWYWYYAHMTNRWATCDSASMQKSIKSLDKNPEFLFAVFPGIDEYSHLSHPKHPSVIERYCWFDQAFGEFKSELVKKNMLDDSMIFIVSDHGLSQTHTHVCLNKVLEENNCSPFFYPKVFNVKDKNSANMISGNGMTHLYFKGDGNWSDKITIEDINKKYPELVSRLLALSAVDIISARDEDGSVKIISRRGSAKVSLDGSSLRYDVLDSDPFGYKLDANCLTSKECLEATIDTDYPDAPFQIAHLFTSNRTGDLVISATPGYDLRDEYEDPEHKSSHGSLFSSHMVVPIATNVKTDKKCIRTVDVYAEIMEKLNVNLSSCIDGETFGG